MKTHCAFGYFTLCGRMPKNKYVYVTKARLAKLVDCKLCKRAIKKGALPLFPNGIVAKK